MMAEPTLNAVFRWNVERVTVTMLPGPWCIECVEGWLCGGGGCVEGCRWERKEYMSNEGRKRRRMRRRDRRETRRCGGEEEVHGGGRGGGGSIASHLAVGLQSTKTSSICSNIALKMAVSDLKPVQEQIQ